MKQIQILSGRGGASGVGIHGFFTGGFILDAGHKRESIDCFAPSSGRNPGCTPALLANVEIPTRWRFALLLPKGYRYSGHREKRFFQEHTPVPKSEVKETLALLHHGVFPAVLEDSIDALRPALREMHRCGFKKRELYGQAAAVRRLFSKLCEIPECAVGMSSLGPLVYAVMREPPQEFLSHLAEIADKEDAVILDICAGRNRGYEVI
ncbi:MAG: beta-ribofuranosylaminobenzene 5'-phosphate synthase family protein [Planctomycetaceae bacterium]